MLATAGNLSDLVEAGSFEDTLFYKISSLSLTVPALREVRGDILANAQHILDEHRSATNASAPFTLTPDAAAWLEAQDWPGNYGHLSRLLRAAAVDSRGPELDVPVLEAEIRASERELVHHEPAPLPIAEAATPAPPEEISVPVPVLTAVATAAPAPRLVAPVSSISPLAARSAFRPASSSYDFIQRLARSLAAAEASTAA